jgi:melanoma-associated antigen
VLKRLKLRENDLVELPATSPHRTVMVDAFLNELTRKHYLDRSKIGVATGKRGRGAVSQADDGEGYEWRWGPRAFSEIGEQAIGLFVAEFMTEHRTVAEDSSDEEGDARARGAKRKARKEENEKRVQAMLRGIEREAGGELLDVI